MPPPQILLVLGTVSLPWLDYAEPPYWGGFPSSQSSAGKTGGIMRYSPTIHYIHRLYMTARQLDMPRSRVKPFIRACDASCGTRLSFVSCASGYHVFYTCFPPKAAVAHVSEILQCPGPGSTPGGIRVQPSLGSLTGTSSQSSDRRVGYQHSLR